jgi:hypothetical protein
VQLPSIEQVGSASVAVGGEPGIGTHTVAAQVLGECLGMGPYTFVAMPCGALVRGPPISIGRGDEMPLRHGDWSPTIGFIQSKSRSRWTPHVAVNLLQALVSAAGSAVGGH